MGSYNLKVHIDEKTETSQEVSVFL